MNVYVYNARYYNQREKLLLYRQLMWAFGAHKPTASVRRFCRSANTLYEGRQIVYIWTPQTYLVPRTTSSVNLSLIIILNIVRC